MSESRRRLTLFSVGTLAALLLAPVAAFGPQSIAISPTTFDFGWCPDNAKITAEFTLKNTGIDVVPLTGVQPTCGCTASQFTPGALATNDETKVLLTFNTRGYANSGFSKNAKVKTDDSNVEYTVVMTGFVTDPAAKVVPDQGGVAAFPPDMKQNSKIINIENKSDKDVKLEIVQRPASWAGVRLATVNVKAGASVPLEIAVDAPYKETKETSVTLAANNGAQTSRLTVAIRTGEGPAPMRQPLVTPAPAVPTH